MKFKIDTRAYYFTLLDIIIPGRRGKPESGWWWSFSKYTSELQLKTIYSCTYKLLIDCLINIVIRY